MTRPTDEERDALRMARAEVMRNAASYVVANHKEDPLTIGVALAALADKIEKGEA